MGLLRPDTVHMERRMYVHESQGEDLEPWELLMAHAAFTGLRGTTTPGPGYVVENQLQQAVLETGTRPKIICMTDAGRPAHS